MENKQAYDLIRMAYQNEWDDAMALVWKTFMQFEAKDYSEKGIESFREFVTDTSLYRMFKKGIYQMLVAIDNCKIVGVITLRDKSHISLLFVDEKYHRMGIGRKLVADLGKYLMCEMGVCKMTVNAAPYGVEFYHKIGFLDRGPEREDDGIRYTPMELELK